MEAVFSSIINHIQKSERILLCTHRKPDGDAIGSIMALYKVLSLLQKEVTAVCADSPPDQFQFLPNVREVAQDIPGAGDFVVTLDCDKTEVDRLKYQLEDNKIHIIITPKKGRFSPENLSCEQKSDHYDLIITVDVADIPQLGKLHEENADLFSSVPVINIDHHVSNTQFGTINVIQPKASSTSEILYGLITALEKQFQKNLITPEVATFLLSGVTTDTGSFQNANTTPRSMEIAADLMEKGASQQDIIKYLFRTKKLQMLKLWGRILERVEVDEKHRLVWSSVTEQDLKATGADAEMAGDIIDELLVHAPEADAVALFKEDPDQVAISLRSKSADLNVADIAKTFGGGGHVQAAGAKVKGKTLQEVMREVLYTLQEAQKLRLGIPEEGETKEEKVVTQVLEGAIEPPARPRPSLEEDIHHKTKAAIAAEQKEAGENASAPSKLIGQAKGQKKIPPAPPAPKGPSENKPPSESGLIVRPAEAKPTPSNPFEIPSPPEEKKEEKKDPFGIGDDGFTDIERALGNL